MPGIGFFLSTELSCSPHRLYKVARAVNAWCERSSHGSHMGSGLQSRCLGDPQRPTPKRRGKGKAEGYDNVSPGDGCPREERGAEGGLASSRDSLGGT